MKQLHATTFNVENDILGRITLSGKNLFGRKDCILVQKDKDSCPFGYSATITNITELKGEKPIVGGLDINEFHEGDVVTINKEGEITFLYEINSTSNAVFATGMCNHRCIMCPQPPVTHEEDMTPFNLKLISLFDKNTQEVGITGGEPTMIGDKLFDLIKQIKKYTPKAAISILSNGVKFADRDYAMKLALCNCWDLQIDVPIFSDIADLHNEIVGAPTFYKTVQGLYNLALFGIKIGIRVVVHKKTYKRLPQLADYIYHNFPFVCNVAFMQMETIGMAEENIKDLWIDPYDYNKQLVEAVEIIRSRGLKASVYNAQLCVLPESIHDVSVQSISGWKDIYMKECEGCTLIDKCGGFFASNTKYHSSHIKPILKYRPLPNPTGEDDDISPFVKENITDDKLKAYSNPIIYDVPIGYGRNTKWLVQQGYNVYGFDLDYTALSVLEKWKQEENCNNLKLYRKDLETISDIDKCDILINVHLYSDVILNQLMSLINPGGLFLLETPELRGSNDSELPEIGYVRKKLDKDFEIITYKESRPKNGHVSVKVLAKKRTL